MPEPHRPTALIILDGWGIDGKKPEGDATELAHPPVMRSLYDRYPHAQLEAAGEAVGLPAGVIGNSEVGHLNLGAGRVVYQDLTRISKSIRDGGFFENAALLTAVRAARDGGRALHLIGLCSDAGVHSHLDHLLGLLELAAREKLLGRVFVHAITDGRDSDPHSGAGYLRAIAGKAKELRLGAIASVSGRYFAMDRDKRWERTKRAWDAIVLRKAPLVDDPIAALEASYRAGKTDEFVEPFAVRAAGAHPLPAVEDGDSVIFWNFRADRARQLTRALTDPGLDGFDRERAPRVHFASMTRYDATLRNPAAFPPQSLDRILAAVLADRGLTQLRVAETEKYAHVTYFFNGGVEVEHPSEKRALVPSAKEVATYDLLPQMRAAEIADEAIARVRKDGRPDFLLLNFANADMVGHSGKLDATLRAVGFVDSALGRLLEALEKAGYATIVTADHGNAEQMIDPETGSPHTAHTTNPVPVILVDEKRRGARLGNGKLCDVAPTVLALMGIPAPREMTGRSLLV